MTKKKKQKTKRALPTFTIPDCKRFTGYKPCFPGTRCYQECVQPDPIGKKILIVNLDAMGNVLVTTGILPAVRRKYPQSHVSWITLPNAAPLLANNPAIDRVYTWEPEAWLVLRQMKFDVVMNIDKSRRAAAFTKSLTSKQKLGFGLDANGVIIPLNKEARENYLLGLDDHLKFRVNKKTVGQILCETFRLKYRDDHYILQLSEEEEAFCRTYRTGQGITPGIVAVGINTGCSTLYPNKKLRVEQIVGLVNRLSNIPRVRVVLVGGPEDTIRNAEIARQVGSAALSTPTTEGLRRGLCYINVCDVVISGDSFGMHAAIGLNKHVLAWFGVTSAPEVNVFGKGMKLSPEGLECSPCWKRECPYHLECLDMVDMEAIVAAVKEYAGGAGSRLLQVQKK